jgi:hypothetical protein
MARRGVCTNLATEVTVLQCLDAGIEIRAEPARLGQELARLYRTCQSSDVDVASRVELDMRSKDGRFSLQVDDLQKASCSDTRELFLNASIEIDRAAITKSSASYVIVHGACVALADRAALIVGPSGVGKSTLAAALTLAGLEYVGDEVLGIPFDSTAVAAFPKPFKLDGRSRRILEKSFPGRAAASADTNHEILVAPEVFGAAAPTRTLATPVVVVAPVFDDRTNATVERLSRADVAELLSDQSFNFASWGARALTTVAAVARACSGVRLHLGDLERATLAIEAILR